MPRLSLYKPEKSADYRFIDKTVYEAFQIGGTDIFVHKYLGPVEPGVGTPTQPKQVSDIPETKIQDLLFLENRDRQYSQDVYTLRGIYNVQDLDMDLSQFGMFLQNDTVFITFHLNKSVEAIGRKLLSGDVLELPHLKDDYALNDFQVSLKRFYVIEDVIRPSEGFSQTWYPHLWRIKCEKLVDSQEFADILRQPTDKDNYLGDWDKNKTYPAGYTMTFGDKNYIALQDVPQGTKPGDTDPDPYWELDTGKTLKDVLGRYNENIRINDANLKEAKRIVPKAGYDTSNLYVVPGYGIFEANGVPSDKENQPAPPVDVRSWMPGNSPLTATGQVITMKSDKYKYDSTGIRIPKEVIDVMQAKHGEQDIDLEAMIAKFVQANLSIAVEAPEMSSTGSGQMEGTKLLTVNISGPVTGPYGTADNTYATADQDPTQPGFTGTEPYGPNTMDYRADCDPRFQYIARYTPRDFGYTSGYLTGEGTPPNGLPAGAGISFPQSPQVGDYFLRIDYTPNVLYRWNGTLWLRVSEDVRTTTGFTETDTSQLSGFINNDDTIYSNNDEANVPSAQGLSGILDLAPDDNPPSDGT